LFKIFPIAGGVEQFDQRIAGDPAFVRLDFIRMIRL
jgi:hypothetical protein